MLRLMFELIAAAGLLGVGVYALRTARYGAARAREFSLIAGFGSLFLAIDEAIGLHERLGAFLYDRGWHEPAGINHLDDLFVMGIAAVGTAAAVVYRFEVFRERRFAGLFGTGLAAFAVAVGWDSLAIADPSQTYAWWTEESLELTGTVLMLAAFRRRFLRLSARAICP